MHEVYGIISGICWSLVYIEIIRLGFKYKTYGMPLFALALNFAWEFLYGFIVPNSHHSQKIINIVWFSLDSLIVITFFMHGFKLFAKGFKKWQFYSWGIFIFALGFIFQFIFHKQFSGDDHAGEGFSAFLQNLIMSALFIGMLFQRANTKGQSLSIAILKCIGTLAATLMVSTKLEPRASFELPNWDWFLIVLGAFCFLFDAMYIILLAKRQKEERLALKN